jgi:hypothetical protein
MSQVSKVSGPFPRDFCRGFLQRHVISVATLLMAAVMSEKIEVDIALQITSDVVFSSQGVDLSQLI